MSSKTVPQQLLIKPGTSWWVSDPELDGLIAPLPDGASRVDDPSSAGVRVLFASSGENLRQKLGEYGPALQDDNVTWIAYPKGNKADINRDSLWPIAGEVGLRPISQVAVDDTWSALRFRPLKDGEAPFTGGKKPD